jgi:hypothetical protein
MCLYVCMYVCRITFYGYIVERSSTASRNFQTLPEFHSPPGRQQPGFVFFFGNWQSFCGCSLCLLWSALQPPQVACLHVGKPPSWFAAELQQLGQKSRRRRIETCCLRSSRSAGDSTGQQPIGGPGPGGRARSSVAPWEAEATAASSARNAGGAAVDVAARAAARASSRVLTDGRAAFCTARSSRCCATCS